MDKILDKYKQYMPKGDDLVLIVLKGHLLLEEQLELIISGFLPNADAIHQAKFNFFSKTALSQAICWRRPDDEMWSLIYSMNSLRNDLAHNLESEKRQSRFDQVIRKHLEMSASDPDFEFLQKCSIHDQLKLAFIHALGFLDRFRIDVEENSSFFHLVLSRQEKLLQELVSQDEGNS